MKVSELSQRSGVSIPTIKFYIRAGMLPPGMRTRKNQAVYHQGHLERLSLIRALRDDAGLSVDAIARGLRAADETKDRKDDFVTAAIEAMARPTGVRVDPASAEYKQAEARLLRCAKRRGWDVHANDVSIRDAARALAVAERSFPAERDEDLEVYADAMMMIARHEIPEAWAPDEAPDATLRYAVLGTVLFEPVILALRRMAHVARARALAHRPQRSKPR